MGWKTEVLIVSKEYRNKNLGGAQRELLDSYLGNWVHASERLCAGGRLESRWGQGSWRALAAEASYDMLIVFISVFSSIA